MHGGGGALLVHQADGAHAVDHAVGAQGEGGRVLSEALVEAVPRRLDADQLDGGVVEEGREEAERVAPTAHAGEQHVRRGTWLGLGVRG